MKELNFILQRKLCSLVILLSLGMMALAVAHEQSTPEKRYVRWRLIEVARKSLVDSILVQLQHGVSFQKLARQHSLHSSAKEGGEMGWANLDSVDSDLKAKMAFLPIGGTSAILPKEMHFFILYKVNELLESGYLKWKEQKSQADSSLRKAELLLNQRNAAAAMALIKDSEELVRQIEDEVIYLRMLSLKGRALRRLGRFREAVTVLNSMLEVSQKDGDRYWVGIALGNLGNAYFSLGEYQQAITYFESALGIAREIGNRKEEGDRLGDLGNAYRLLGHFQLAIAFYDSALVIARKIGNRKSEGGWSGSLGNACLALGQYQQAITYYANALSIAREIGFRQDEGGWLGSLGNASLWLGQHQRAIAYFDSALGIAREIGDQQAEGAWLGGLGYASLWLGQHQRATAYFDSALVIAREIGAQQVEGVCLGSLGAVYSALGQYQRAIALHDSALAIARKVGDRYNERVGLGALGDTYLSLGQYDKAIAFSDSALFVAKEIGDAEGMCQGYWSLARSHVNMPQTKTNEVINFFDNAVEAVERVTGQLIQDVHKLSFLKGKQALYYDYINYLMAQTENLYHERALEISEASRTRALRDLLQGQRIQTPLAVEKRISATKRTEELFQQFAAAQIAQADISNAFRAGVDDSLETWATQIQIPPDTLGSSEGAPAIRMREIQAEAKTSTLLEYHVLDDGIAIWVVGQSGKVFSFKQNVPKEKLRALIDSVRQALGVESLSFRNVKSTTLDKKTTTLAYKPALQTLDSLLIQPVERYLPRDTSRELIILPHDILFLLPFGCLMDNSGKYLVERYSFSTAPSVGLLKFTRGRIREQQYREKPKLLLMGNPEMPDAKMWPPLAGAEQEVKRIAQHVNQKKGAGFQAQGALPLQALPLTKAQATEAEFRQIAGIQNYLHLATHGYVVSDALRCGLVLAKTGIEMETDGILTTAEIFGLPLNAELVVLSACQTGLGQISSDGVAGLSRAFLYAGASSLIVSLWKVSDAATQDLMVKFYEELARDGNKARALRAAQLFTMKKYPHPRDWAAFVLMGQPN